MVRILALSLLGMIGFCLPGSAQQFGEDRPKTPPPMPPVAQPAAPTPTPAVLPSFPTTNAPRALQTPPAATAPQPTEPPHQWAVRPENGAWMICVMSYTGPDARKKAEELAGLIRRDQRVAAFLYERGAEERQREEQRRAEWRQKKELEMAPFIQVQAQMKQRAAAQGIEFFDAPMKYRIPTIEVSQQWAVLVGGFKSMDEASAYHTTIRTWPPPKAVHLMDSAVMARPEEGGKVSGEATYLNPFKNAMVFPNPSIRRTPAQGVPMDPVIVKLNESEPLSLLKCRKSWTLAVKDFSVPTTVQSKDQEGGIMAKLFGKANDPADLLEATAKQAQEFAKALRDPKMDQAVSAAATRLGLTPRPLETYVLHVRTGSRVTIGQFDAPDDPALVEMQRLLLGMWFKIEQKGQLPEERRLFDSVTVMPIPRP